MAKIRDYPNYEPDKREIESAKHKGNTSIIFDVFYNKVIELKDEKALLIHVDDYFDSDVHFMAFAEDEGYEDVDEYITKYHQELLEYNPDHFEYEKEKMDEHKQVLAAYSEKFQIQSPYNDKNQDFQNGYKEALSTALAAAVVKVHLGEGLLDFCYADFNETFNECEPFYRMFSEEYLQEMRREKGFSTETKVLEIKNRAQHIIQNYMRYTDAISFFRDVINTSLYSAINPPMLINQNRKAFNRYKSYILDLQTEILELIEFCYDEEFYPTLLDDLTPAQRFALYHKVHEKKLRIERTEIYQIGPHLGGPDLPTTEKTDLEIKDINVFDQESLDRFTKQFGIDPLMTQGLLTYPNFSHLYYQCCTIYEMLMLEFTKMLEYNVRFKKCKNCGRYFILKGNYPTDFCNRIPEGQNQSCQTIGALKNYKSKIKNSPAWSLYNKYYKRYFARMKAGNISPEVFKKWQYKATTMRDNCNEGKVPIQDLEDFLFHSFKNTKK